MNWLNLHLVLPNLLPYSSKSVFKLIDTKSEMIMTLNHGYNGEGNNIGFFHVVGYNPEYDMYLLAKPVQEINEPKLKCFQITNEFYKENCTDLLVFNLNNN